MTTETTRTDWIWGDLMPLGSLSASDLRDEVGAVARDWLAARDELPADFSGEDAIEMVDALGDSVLGDRDGYGRLNLDAFWFRVDRPGADPMRGQGLIVAEGRRGRIGLMLNGDSQWGDVDLRADPDADPDEATDIHPDIIRAIDDWLNDAEAWEARA